jgi:phage tail sheath protein FI
MPDSFLHGVQVIDVTDGARTISTVASSVIGLVGTAPNADPSVFPLNIPVLISGSQSLAAKLASVNNGPDYGTLPGAVQDIFDITGAVVVVVRVAPGASDTATMANIIGGVDGNGSYTGAHGFLAANSLLGVKPRILIAQATPTSAAPRASLP